MEADAEEGPQLSGESHVHGRRATKGLEWPEGCKALTAWMKTQKRRSEAREVSRIIEF